MKRLILILVLLAVFLVGCTVDEHDSLLLADLPTIECDGEGDTMEEFNSLVWGMSYAEVRECVGVVVDMC